MNETIDISKSEQIAIFVRCPDVYRAKCIAREDFAGFVNAFTTLSDMNLADKFVGLTGQKFLKYLVFALYI